MSLEVTGKLILKLELQSGVSKTGNSWKKQEFVIETGDQYPRKICINLWGDKADQLAQYNIGDAMTVSFDVESREFNGKWYTDVKAWKIEHAQASNGMPANVPPQPAAYNAAPFNPANIQTAHTAYAPAADMSSNLPPVEGTFTDDNLTDDLPF